MSEQGNLKIEIIDFSDDLKDPIRLLNYEWLQKYFRIEEGDNCLLFSYTMEDFSQKNMELLIKAKLLTPKKRNKLYNSIVVLSALN